MVQHIRNRLLSLPVEKKLQKSVTSIENISSKSSIFSDVMFDTEASKLVSKN